VSIAPGKDLGYITNSSISDVRKANEMVNYKLDRVLEILTTNSKVDRENIEISEENEDTDFVMPDLPKSAVEEVLNLNKHLESIAIRNKIVSISPHYFMALSGQHNTIPIQPKTHAKSAVGARKRCGNSVG
jgi:hypothetical protein